VFEGVLDGFPLRIEHGFFRCDDDFCFHGSAATAAVFTDPDVAGKEFFRQFFVNAERTF
jgi:hypothetical protein